MPLRQVSLVLFLYCNQAKIIGNHWRNHMFIDPTSHDGWGVVVKDFVLVHRKQCRIGMHFCNLFSTLSNLLFSTFLTILMVI